MYQWCNPKEELSNASTQEVQSPVHLSLKAAILSLASEHYHTLVIQLGLHLFTFYFIFSLNLPFSSFSMSNSEQYWIQRLCDINTIFSCWFCEYWFWICFRTSSVSSSTSRSMCCKDSHTDCILCQGKLESTTLPANSAHHWKLTNGTHTRG